MPPVRLRTKRETINIPRHIIQPHGASGQPTICLIRLPPTTLSSGLVIVLQATIHLIVTPLGASVCARMAILAGRYLEVRTAR